MKTPQIALIGTEGAGKTVLVTVLAKRLATPQNGVWLNPQGAKTGKEIEKNWNTLRRGEWLPSTPAGTLFDLKWELRVGDREYPMKVIDSAGQDLRRLFSDDGFGDPNLSDQDLLFIDYIRSATVLLVLVNLRDFIGEPDENRVIENAFTLKGLLDQLKADKEERQVVFLFTAYDQYETTIKKDYGTVWNFFEKELSYLYHAHISGKPVKCFPVAAVAETEAKVDSDGISRRVPAHDFRSQGLEPFVQWLAEAVSDDIDKQEQEKIAAEQARVSELRRQNLKKNMRILKKIAAIIVAIAAVVIVIGECVGYGHNKYIEAKNAKTASENAKIEAEKARIALETAKIDAERARKAAEDAERKRLEEAEKAKKPQPQLADKWNWNYSCLGLLCQLTDDHTVQADIPVKNNGTGGNIRVICTVGNRDGHTDSYFNRGETKTIRVNVKPDRHDYREASISFSVP